MVKVTNRETCVTWNMQCPWSIETCAQNLWRDTSWDPVTWGTWAGNIKMEATQTRNEGVDWTEVIR